jgi:anti-sigma B factor antagonist
MRIGERLIGGVAVVDLAGKLTLTDGPGLVKDVVTSLVFRGHRQIVLNLAGVGYIDSSGLGELVACHLTAARAGGAIKLANAGPRVLDLLILTKLLTIFEAHPSEESAIMSFAGAAV